MKKLFAFLAAAVIAPTGLVGCEKSDQLVDPNRLPDKAQNFITNHFSAATIKNVVKEYDDMTYTYDVYLSDGTQIEFKRGGDWLSIDNRQTGVPSSIFPENIQSYLTTNYPNTFVVDVDRDWQYDVELSNGVELDFTLGGKIVIVDY